MISQKCGDWTLKVWTDGWPNRADLVLGNHRKQEIGGVSVSDLHDLRYAIDRILQLHAEHEGHRVNLRRSYEGKS